MYLCWAFNLEVSIVIPVEIHKLIEWKSLPHSQNILKGTATWSQRHPIESSNPNLVPVGLVSVVGPLTGSQDSALHVQETVNQSDWESDSVLPVNQSWKIWFGKINPIKFRNRQDSVLKLRVLILPFEACQSKLIYSTNYGWLRQFQ